MLIVPAIDLLGGRVVRLVRGDYGQVLDYDLDPLSAARGFVQQGARRLHVVDLEGARRGTPAHLPLISDLTALNVEIEFGGGLRSLLAAEQAANAGASRLVVGTGALDPTFLEVLMRRFGKDRVVVSIDAQDGRVKVGGWLQDANLSAVELAEQLHQAGVRQFIVSDIARDGTLGGVDPTPLASYRLSGVSLGVAGGVSSLEDVRALTALGFVDYAIVGRALYDGQLSYTEAQAACSPNE